MSRADDHDHAADGWTVGHLRRALESLSDEMSLTASTPVGRPKTTSEAVDEDWVVVGVGTRRVITDRLDGAAEEMPGTLLAIELGRPAIQYSQSNAVSHRAAPTPLLTKAELKEWLKVSDFWVRDRLENDPEFVQRCVVDLAPEGSSRRTLRYHVDRTARYLGIE